MEYFAGVDTHRDTHSIVILDELGKVVESFAIEATSQGYAQAIDRMRTVAPLQWGLEGTGSYGRGFADALLRAGYTVYEVPGVLTKRHRRRLRHRGKSDPQDAHAIAEAVLRERETLPRHLEEDQQQALRLLYDRRDRLVTEHTAKVNRVRALALRLEVPASSNLGTHRALERLRSALDQRPSLGYADFEVADELRSLIDDLTRIQNALAELEKRMRPFVERLAPALLGLRGCSIVTASGFIGHTGTIQNYRSADAFATHAGVAPLSCSSGKYQSVRVNNGGNRQLNRCLHIIANTQIRTPDHPGKIYYERKRTEGKTHRAAMRCLKRKLANVIFNVLKEAANGFPETTLHPVAA